MPLEPGRTLAHYRIIRQIGEGGMGAVFLAEDTKLDRQVALKVLPPQMASDPDRLERFQREAKAVAALNHPHIVTIHSVEEETGTHFLTMELVEGDSLDRDLPPTGLPLDRVFDVGIAMADALAAAHEKGIIHRDLKPSNVMLTKDGRVKVLDFGLAKLAPWAGPGAVTPDARLSRMATRDRSLTRTGVVTGTAPYMSPEQVQGKPVDTRTDVFSLGVVLYELTTGRRPFQGGSPAEIMSSILRDAPELVTEVRREAPRHLARIIDHCLEKEPDARFQTAKDVRNQLRALRKEAGATEAPSALLSGSAAASGETGAADRPRRGWWIGLSAGAVLIAATLLWIGRDVFSPQRDAAPTLSGGSGQESATVVPAMTTTASIAVLPFVDMSADKNQEYFSDGLSEELINVLTRIPELKVTGRTSSFAFKGKSEDLKSIAEKLGVANILEGSVRKAGDRVRITAQLVKAADGFHIWSQTYDRSLDDIFAVQDDIAGSVARELRVRLLPNAGVLREADAAAFDFELQARFVLNTRWTPASDRVAGQILERGLAVAPGDARLWRTKARLHSREVLMATSVEARREAFKQVRAALAKVLELDPTMNADPTMAWSHWLGWEYAEAERMIGRALDEAPSASNAAGLFNLWMGRPAEAITLFDRAVDLDPLDVRVHQNKAAACLEVGRLDEAETLLRLALDLSPDWSGSYHTLFELHMLRGEMEEARMALARYGELANQSDYWRLFADAVTEPAEGRPASSAAADEFEKRFGSENPMECARIRAWRGESDAAFVWLDKALAARDPLLARVKGELGLRSLRTDPRWNVLLRKVGLPTD